VFIGDLLCEILLFYYIKITLSCQFKIRYYNKYVRYCVDNLVLKNYNYIELLFKTAFLVFILVNGAAASL